MHIVLATQTRRGLLFLKKLRALCPDDTISVVSTGGADHEPPYLDTLREECRIAGYDFYEGRTIPLDLITHDNGPVDFLLAVHWRHLIDPATFSTLPLGSWVFHDSLLPQYRGWAPLCWAIINGEDKAGATLFELTTKFDEGPILDQKSFELDKDETITSAMVKTVDAYAQLLEWNLRHIKAGTASARCRPQPTTDVSFGAKRIPEDGLLSKRDDLHSKARALARPYTGAFTTFKDRKLTIWSCETIDPVGRTWFGTHGQVLEVRPGIGTVIMWDWRPILLKEVQLEGYGPQRADEVLTQLSHRIG